MASFNLIAGFGKHQIDVCISSEANPDPGRGMAIAKIIRAQVMNSLLNDRTLLTATVCGRLNVVQVRLRWQMILVSEKIITNAAKIMNCGVFNPSGISLFRLVLGIQID